MVGVTLVWKSGWGDRIGDIEKISPLMPEQASTVWLVVWHLVDVQLRLARLGWILWDVLDELRLECHTVTHQSSGSSRLNSIDASIDDDGK
jgi:hypothetical protein